LSTRAPLRSARTGLAALVWGNVLLSFVPKAEAAPPFYVGIRYETNGEACWDAAEFTRNVARSVGYDPFRVASDMIVDVSVRDVAGSLEGRLSWSDARGARIGERRFVAKDRDCPKLLREMSFAVALQIDLLRPDPLEPQPAPSSEARAPDPAPATTATAPTKPAETSASTRAVSDERRPAPPVPARRSTEAPDPQATPRRASAFRFSLGVGPALAWRLSPGMTGQGRLFASARRGDYSLELAAEAMLPVDEQLEDGAGFRQSLAGGSAVFCAHGGAFGACVLAKLSRLSVTGFDLDRPSSPSAVVGQAGARLTAMWELSERWFLSPHIDALALLTPRDVRVNGVSVWEMPSVAMTAGVGAGVHFR